MEVDPGPFTGLGDQSELLSLVSQLLDDTTSHTIIQTYRADLPELLDHTAQFVLHAGASSVRWTGSWSSAASWSGSTGTWSSTWRLGWDR